MVSTGWQPQPPQSYQMLGVQVYLQCKNSVQVFTCTEFLHCNFTCMQLFITQCFSPVPQKSVLKYLHVRILACKKSLSRTSPLAHASARLLREYRVRSCANGKWLDKKAEGAKRVYFAIIGYAREAGCVCSPLCEPRKHVWLHSSYKEYCHGVTV